MIEVFFAPTPNGWKVTILLEELGAPYRITPVNFADGGQLPTDFLAVSPNGKIPAIIDHEPAQGEAISVFETGAILLYLAEKHGRFLPNDAAGRYACIEWLMWQVSGLGPALGQHGHFQLYAQEENPYAQVRFRNEAERLYGVLDRRLEKTGRFVAGSDYTIADIACFPWVMTHKAQKIEMARFPHVKRWFAELRARPSLQRGLVGIREFSASSKTMSPELQRTFFGQSPSADTARENPAVADRE